MAWDGEMNNRPIQVGDLVQVVRGMPCCGAVTPMQGHIFKVTGFKETKGKCKNCSARANGWMSAKGGMFPIDVPRLKRIPPLSELEGQRTEEGIKEPA